MSMANAYAAGRRNSAGGQSYIPLISALQSRRGGGGRGNIPNSAIDLKREQWKAEQDRIFDAENEIRAQNAGRIPTSLELAREQQAYNRGIKERELAMENRDALDKRVANNDAMFYKKQQDKIKQGNVEKKLGMAERAVGAKEREVALKEGEFGLKKKAADITFDKEAKYQDYLGMLQGFAMNDPMSVMTYFMKHSPEDSKGGKLIPFFELDENGQMVMTLPGHEEAVPVTQDIVDQFGIAMNPKWETPTSDKEIAGTEKIRAEAKSKGALSTKDRINLAAKRAEYGPEFEKYYSNVPATTDVNKQTMNDASGDTTQLSVSGMPNVGEIKQSPKDKLWYRLKPNGKFERVPGPDKGLNDMAKDYGAGGKMSANDYIKSGLADQAKSEYDRLGMEPRTETPESQTADTSPVDTGGGGAESVESPDKDKKKRRGKKKSQKKKKRGKKAKKKDKKKKKRR